MHELMIQPCLLWGNAVSTLLATLPRHTACMNGMQVCKSPPCLMAHGRLHGRLLLTGLASPPQVVTNRETQETLLCLAYVFEVCTNNDGPKHHVYRLIKENWSHSAGVSSSSPLSTAVHVLPCNTCSNCSWSAVIWQCLPFLKNFGAICSIAYFNYLILLLHASFAVLCVCMYFHLLNFLCSVAVPLFCKQFAV